MPNRSIRFEPIRRFDRVVGHARVNTGKRYPYMSKRQASRLARQEARRKDA